LEIRQTARLIPRDCIIDVRQRVLCRMVSKPGPQPTTELVPVARLELELFLGP
jgi:hypothetical protein